MCNMYVRMCVSNVRMYLLEIKLAIQKASSTKPSLVTTTQESVRHSTGTSAVVTSQSIVSSSATACVSQPAPLTTTAHHAHGKF